MRKNVYKVLVAFARGEACDGKSVSTNGQSLYSYAMCIGYRQPNGDVVLVEHGELHSETTKSHIRAAEQHFGKVARVAVCS